MADIRIPRKREFGRTYLGSVAMVLSLGLSSYLLAGPVSPIIVLVGGGSSLGLFGALLYIGSLCRATTFTEDFVWTVSQWTGLGLGFGTLMSLLAGMTYEYVPTGRILPGLIVLVLTTGGLIGALIGVISGLRTQKTNLEQLTQRNTVLNRVLRHNIKNDMNVILGRTTLLREECGDASHHSVDAIERAAKNVTNLSKNARRIDRLTAENDQSPVNAAAIVRESVESIDNMYPGADFESDLGDSIWVETGPLLGAVVTNLLENAVEHNDGEPTIRTAVSQAGGEVQLTVADDGPGILEPEHEILDAEQEQPIQHGSGLGLWLAKWFVDQHNGSIEFAQKEPTGTIVTVTLPKAAK
jgi:signal transduction histidine kinase